jgi:type I pantothenate kinase
MHDSPYVYFSRAEWKQYRSDTPLTLTEADLAKLRGFNESVSLTEVADIYLPLSRLLSLYVAAAQQLHQGSSAFLGHSAPKVPYIIGVAGSVAVGKSTTSRILQALLSRWQNHPRVALLTTDNFLYSNRVLEREGLMHRKGFPESFDVRALIHFLLELKSGKPALPVPVYSHEYYDILPDEQEIIDQPDILILEGLNVLQQTIHAPKVPRLFVSDLIDFSVYVHAETTVIEKWYLDRFLAFRERAKQLPALFFHRFTQMPKRDAYAYAKEVWKTINEANLVENILPYQERARLILTKGEDHSVQAVALRKL